MSFRETLIRAARGTVLMRVGYMALSLAGSVVLARALGPDAYGIYAFVFALVNVMAIPAQAGVPPLLVRETAKAHATARWPALKGVWRWCTRLILVTSLTVGTVALIGVVLFSSATDSVTRTTLYVGLLLLPLLALGDARGAALRGLGLIVRGQLPESIIRPGLLLVLAGGVWWVTGDLTAPGAMALHVAAAIIAFLIGAVLLLRARPSELDGVEVDTSSAAEWRSAILPLAMIGGVHMVSAQVGVVLLGLFRPEAEVGIYKVAASISVLAVVGLQMANVVVQPHIARLFAIRDIALLQRLAGLAALVSTGITIPVFLLFIFGGKPLLRLLYGDAYVAAWLPLVVLGVGQFVSAIFGSVALLLSMTGHERDSFRWLTIAAASNIFLSLILIPKMGMLGAALSYAMSLGIWNVAFRWVALKRVGVDGSIFFYLRR